MGYFTDMFVDTAVLKTVNGTDENGRPNIIALDEINCKIEMKKAITVTSLGQEKICSGRLFTEAILKPDDILEIKNNEFKVIEVTPYYPLTSKFCVVNEVHFS